MNDLSPRLRRRGQHMYLMEAALEYLISILVTGSFLATLTKQLGMSDSLTGILSAISSLGCLFQLLSLFITRTRVKGVVITASVINQLLFMFLYIIPLTGWGKPVKTALFIAVILLAYLLYNLVHPKKINWLMSLVEETHRGRFTAVKEIISLVSGIVFSFGMSAMIDYFAAAGQIRLAFILCAAAIFASMVFHTVTMLLSAEKQAPNDAPSDLRHTVRDLIGSKTFRHILVMYLLYYASTYVSVPFYGTYQIGELGMTLNFVSIITIGGSLSRILVSTFWGRYADKNSFAAMVEKSWLFLALAQVCVIFATPTTGKVMFIGYQILYGIAMGGVNGGLVNLIFERIPARYAAGALAITQALAGASGFLITLAVSPLVSYIQQNGNTLFGLSVYAQQVVTGIALVLTVSAILYTRRTFRGKPKA